MKLVVDQNNLITIEHPEIPKIKEYTYEVAWLRFSDWDKWMIVLHKKDFKIVNLKNLWDGMNVVYIKNNDLWQLDIKQNCIQQAFGLFNSFDEVLWQQKYFFPWARTNNESIAPVSCNWEFATSEEILSFFYWLILLYWKFESKWTELMSIKIQIPLFGQYLKYQESFDYLIKLLQRQWIFFKRDSLETNNWIIYQISSNDWESLGIFAKWHETIEKFEKITRKEFTEQMKAKLLAFLVSDSSIPENGKDQVLESIENWVLKFLIK